MKYSLLIYNDSELTREPEEARQIEDAIAELLERPNVAGYLQLAGVATTTTVRHDRGRTLLTDGPFIESKDYLGGFINLEVDDLDAAIAIAAEIQELRSGAGAIEIRPVEGESHRGA